MKHLLVALLCLTGAVAIAQPQQQTTHEIAFGYMRTGDFDNAILVLNKALQQDPDNQQLMQDLALSYFYKKDYAKAKEQTELLINRKDADIVSFQLAGNVYKALEEVKEADKMYKKALKKFPNSGALYNEYAEMFYVKNDNATAIRLWEKGIEVDPSYAGNYFNAASYYHLTKDKVWAIIYGEIFVNMEYLSGNDPNDRTTEMKKLLLNSYKEKLFNNIGQEESVPQSPFAKAVLETFGKQSALLGKGLTLETLTMIRTKFILDWFAKHGSKFPFRLFDYHQQLIKEGMFEAYNQWLFGPVDNLNSFDQWTKTHAAAYKKFIDWQRGRVFKMPVGQFYQAVAKSK